MEKRSAARPMSEFRPQIRLRLIGEEPFFGPGVSTLLWLIDETGSLQQACRKMGLSYSKGRKILTRLDRELGFSVVERWTGGSRGGGSRLSAQGRRLLRRYDALAQQIQHETERLYADCFRESYDCGQEETEQ